MNARVAQVSEELGTEKVNVESVEVGGMGNVWYVCSVEGEVTHKPPQPVIATEARNRFDCLTEEDKDGECKGQSFKAWPVVGKGGKVSKGVTGNVGKRGRHQKFKKFDLGEEVKFIG